MKTFRKEIRASVKSAYAGRCATDGCLHLSTEAHHIVPNTKINNERWPIYIQSPMNMIPLCYECHHNKPLPKKPNHMLLDIYENFLQSN